ncbi:amidohydrolase [Lutibacter sp. B2]|nr:amidohydrolase [Lutibacter sp. B2]
MKLIFQPAEEYVSGAKKMIEEGVLENPKVDMVLGAHIWQPLKNGCVGIKPGAFMASSDNFSIEIKGKSAHGAMPHEGIDCIAAASDFITGIQSLLTRTIPSNENYVLSFGKISGGMKENTIAEKFELKGTFRTFSIEVKEHIEYQIKNYLKSKELTHNITWNYELMNSSLPTINDHDLALKVKKSIQNIIGEENVIPFGPVMPAEDFSEYCMRVPSVFFFLGTGDEKYIYPHHHPKFDINEDVLYLGTASFTQAIIDLLK